MITIAVEHVGARYDVLVGPISMASGRIAALGSTARPLPVISDERVFALHGECLSSICASPPILVPEGEEAKQWGTLQQIVERLAATNVPRGTPILALGGGSVGDVAGLAASLFKRGCPIIHVPTTLLAQADSAIGGKTAIGACGQKNLVGTFHHPSLVVADPAFLDTLDARQMRSGYAEVVKYGLIDDTPFFDWCEANGLALLQGDRQARQIAIEHCIRSKARVVAGDPADVSGNRALLNFGHSFGHAIEALAGDDLPHGEAVAVGMVLAFRFSEELGLCNRGDVERVTAHLKAAGLPTQLSELGVERSAEKLMALIRADKKAESAAINLILTRGIGGAFLARGVDGTRLESFLHDHV